MQGSLCAGLVSASLVMEITLGAPPQRIPLTIAACGELDCPYELLKTFVSEHVRSDCLTTAASGP